MKMQANRELVYLSDITKAGIFMINTYLSTNSGGIYFSNKRIDFQINC